MHLACAAGHGRTVALLARAAGTGSSSPSSPGLRAARAPTKKVPDMTDVAGCDDTPDTNIFTVHAAGQLHWPTHDGATPAYLAAAGGHVAALQALVEAGADLRAGAGLLPEAELERCIRLGGSSLGGTEMARGSADALPTPNWRGQSALHRSAGRGQLEAVRLLLSATFRPLVDVDARLPAQHSLPPSAAGRGEDVRRRQGDEHGGD